MAVEEEAVVLAGAADKNQAKAAAATTVHSFADSVVCVFLSCTTVSLSPSFSLFSAEPLSQPPPPPPRMAIAI